MLSYKRKNREWEGADERNETNEKKPPGKVGGGGVLAGGLAGSEILNCRDWHQEDLLNENPI